MDFLYCKHICYVSMTKHHSNLDLGGVVVVGSSSSGSCCTSSSNNSSWSSSSSQSQLSVHTLLLHASTSAHTLKTSNPGSHTIIWICTKILYTLVETGSAALAAAVSLPR